MEHSESYNELKKQLMSLNKKDGYNVNVLSNIYETERKFIERKIYYYFKINHDFDLALFLPQLQFNDGIKLLKKLFSKSSIPSRESFITAYYLYKATEKKNI